MPEEQRIITAGFVTIALVVLGVLAYFLIPGEGVDDALDQIQGELFPAYLEAEERGNYAEQRTAAEKILDSIKKGGRATIQKNLEALAIGDDRKTQRLSRMVSEGEFEKIAAGEFPFEKKYYPANVHRGLRGMKEMVSEEFGTLRMARDLANQLKAAVEQARIASGQPIPAPPPFDVKGAVDLKSDPILDADAQLFAYFAIDPALLVAALKSKNPGGRANSARIVWNRDMAQSGLTARIKELPPRLTFLEDVAARFSAYAKDVEGYPQGPAAAAQIYADAIDVLAKGLDTKALEQLNQNRKQYESGTIIRELLDAEVKLLKAGETRMPLLADSLLLKFPK